MLNLVPIFCVFLKLCGTEKRISSNGGLKRENNSIFCSFMKMHKSQWDCALHVLINMSKPQLATVLSRIVVLALLRPPFLPDEVL